MLKMNTLILKKTVKKLNSGKLLEKEVGVYVEVLKKISTYQTTIEKNKDRNFY